MQGSTWVKICGVTLPEDLEMICAAGADAVGLNFIPRSKRRVDLSLARRIASMAKGKIERIGVVADLTRQQILELVQAVDLDRVQLHGNEPSELVEELGSIAYKAIGIESSTDVEIATGVPGNVVLVDAKSGGMVGGTGTTFDWRLVADLCRARQVILAGGIGPANVARAIRSLSPFGIDVASGVELPGQSGVKDEEALLGLMRAIREAHPVEA